jgi:CubicO group peptidase (beta-lactamase class C family)
MKIELLLFRSLTVAILLTFLCCAGEKSSGITIPYSEALDEILNQYVENGAYPFLYARLEDLNGSVLYEHSAVNRELLPNTQIDGDTWMRIWSMSKIVTITVALDLVEEGILSLDDPVTKYIPEFQDLQVAVTVDGEELAALGWENRENGCPFNLVSNDSIMTVLHLIDHEAGFYYATTNIKCLDSLLAKQNIVTAKNSKEFIDRLAELPLLQHPGSHHFYGTNTTVLGLVAERATGKSLKTLVEERITEPLNIEGLQYTLPPGVKLLPRFSGKDTVLREAYRGELDIFGPDVPDYDPGHELYLGGEGMLGTADGYADFIRMLLNRGKLNGNRYLDRATVEDIHAPHTQLDNPYGYNGYNLWISGDSMRINEQGDAGLWIGGGYEGTHFWADPKRNFVGIIMTQMYWIQPPGYGKDEAFRGELYKQIWATEETD